MGFVKDVKPPAYHKRFQVKFARRRSGHTDYRARKRLVAQDKNKYNSPKYRFVVRFSNKDITCQVIYATLAGDVCICAAYAHELPRYGLKFGLTNYAAAYCVGLLCARRLLTKVGLADEYEGQDEIDGEDYHVEAGEDARPFKCYLDVGIKRTSTGAKVFAAMKGACDGGLNIPHNEKRYVGYDKDSKELDTEMFQKYLTGGHVAEYMQEMRDEEPEKYEAHFAKYLAEDQDPDELEELYPTVHEAIREDPSFEKKERETPSEKKRWKMQKLTYEEKKANLKERLLALRSASDE